MVLRDVATVVTVADSLGVYLERNAGETHGRWG